MRIEPRAPRPKPKPRRSTTSMGTSPKSAAHGISMPPIRRRPHADNLRLQRPQSAKLPNPAPPAAPSSRRPAKPMTSKAGYWSHRCQRHSRDQRLQQRLLRPLPGSIDPLGHGSFSQRDAQGRVVHTAVVEDYSSHTNKLYRWMPSRWAKRRPVTTRWGEVSATTTWLVARGSIDPENRRSRGWDGIAVTAGMTSQTFYDSNSRMAWVWTRPPDRRPQAGRRHL